MGRAPGQLWGGCRYCFTVSDMRKGVGIQEERQYDPTISCAKIRPKELESLVHLYRRLENQATPTNGSDIIVALHTPGVLNLSQESMELILYIRTVRQVPVRLQGSKLPIDSSISYVRGRELWENLLHL